MQGDGGGRSDEGGDIGFVSDDGVLGIVILVSVLVSVSEVISNKDDVDVTGHGHV